MLHDTEYHSFHIIIFIYNLFVFLLSICDIFVSAWCPRPWSALRFPLLRSSALTTSSTMACSGVPFKAPPFTTRRSLSVNISYVVRTVLPVSVDKQW